MLIQFMFELGMVVLEIPKLERKNVFWDLLLNFCLCRNYGPTILAQIEAAKKGYAQVLWLYGKEGFVTEVGTMNQFFFWVNKSGKKELITAPLDGTILPGVTRDSILTLCREWKEFEVTERPYTIGEVVEAIEDGRVIT
jgi:branched-chain amino acid aminotransferase